MFILILYLTTLFCRIKMREEDEQESDSRSWKNIKINSSNFNFTTSFLFHSLMDLQVSSEQVYEPSPHGNLLLVDGSVGEGGVYR